MSCLFIYFTFFFFLFTHLIYVALGAVCDACQNSQCTGSPHDNICLSEYNLCICNQNKIMGDSRHCYNSDNYVGTLDWSRICSPTGSSKTIYARSLTHTTLYIDGLPYKFIGHHARHISQQVPGSSHVIAIHAKGELGSSNNGNSYDLTVSNAVVLFITDGRCFATNWKCSSTLQDGWSSNMFDDSSWVSPIHLGGTISEANFQQAQWFWLPDQTITDLYCRFPVNDVTTSLSEQVGEAHVLCYNSVQAGSPLDILFVTQLLPQISIHVRIQLGDGSNLVLVTELSNSNPLPSWTSDVDVTLSYSTSPYWYHHTHSFSIAGSYLINATVVGFNGASVSFSRSVNVYGVADSGISLTTAETTAVAMTTTSAPLLFVAAEVQCRSNCAESVNPSEKLVLQTFCLENCYGDLTYSWALSIHNAVDDFVFDWDSHTRSGRERSILAIKAGTFPGNETARYNFTVFITANSTSVSSSSYEFVVNSPPYGGSCMISPSSGFALQTMFTLGCSDFVDSNTPLTYKVFSISTTNSRSMLNSGEIPQFNITLPIGNQGNQYIVPIQIDVCDAMSSCTNLELSVTVEPSSLSISELRSVVNGTNSSLSLMIGNGDHDSAVQLIYSFSSQLTVDTAADEQLKTEIRSTLVSSLADIPVTTPDRLQQTAAAVTQVTSVAAELTPSSQSVAASTLLSLSSFLKEQSSNDMVSSAKQQVSSDIVSAVGNLMESLSQSSSAETTYNNSSTQVRNSTQTSMQAVALVRTSLLDTLVPNEPPLRLHTPQISLALTRLSPSELVGRQCSSGSDLMCSGVGIPAEVITIGNVASSPAVDTEITEFTRNPYLWSNTSSTISSPVSDIAISLNGSSLSVSNLSEPIDIFITQPSNIEPIMVNFTVSEQTVNVVKFNITDNSTNFNLYIDLPPFYLQISSLYLNLQVFKQILNQTEFIVGNNYTVESPVLYNGTASLLTLSGASLSGPGEYFTTLSIRSDGEPVPESISTQQISASLWFVTQNCLFWNEVSNDWSTFGCQVGANSSRSVLQCSCTHLTSFASNFFIMPNTFDIHSTILKFATFWENPTVIALVSCILVVYIIGIVFAYRKDKLDQLHTLPVVLKDSHPKATYQYLVRVYTGSRRSAGTTSTVTLTLNGSKSSSQPFILRSPDWKVCQRNNVDTFVLKTLSPLGDVSSVRFWHDNSGSDPSWFVSRVILIDSTLDKDYYIVCNEWLALDLDNGLIDKTFKVSTSLEKKQFNHVFSTQVSRTLQDDNLWFSVFTRPSDSPFTRVQRVSCCLALFCSYMLTNIMFYGVYGDPAEERMDLGPFTVRWSEVLIGIETSLLMFPVNILVIQLFRLAESGAKCCNCTKKSSNKYLVDENGDGDKSDITSIQQSFSETDFKSFEDFSNDQLKNTFSSSPEFISISDSNYSTTLQDKQSVHQRTKNNRPNKPVDPIDKTLLKNSFVFQSFSSINTEEKSNMDSQFFQHINYVDEFDVLKNEDGKKRKNSDVNSNTNHLTNPSLNHNSNNHIEGSNSISKNNKNKTDNENIAVELDNKLSQLMKYLDNDSSSSFEYLLNIFNPSSSSLSISNLSLSDRQESYVRERCCRCKLVCNKQCFIRAIAWLLIFAISFTGMFFTTLYSFDYGLEKSISWLKSLFISTFQCIFIEGPLKAVCFALVLGLLKKNDQFYGNVMIHVPTAQEKSELGDEHNLNVLEYEHLLNTDSHYRPPTPTAIWENEEIRHQSKRMYSIGKEIIGYLFYMYLLLLIAYGKRDANIYRLNSSLDKVLFGDGSLEKITFESFWEWSETTLIDVLYERTDETVMINLCSVLIGSPLIIQQRAMKDSMFCETSELLSLFDLKCKGDVSEKTFGEFNGSFIQTDSYNKSWNFRDLPHLDSYVTGELGNYYKNGFVIELGRNRSLAKQLLTQLKENKWLDSDTSAIIVYFIAYSPNVNLLTYVSCLFEIPPTGGFILSKSINSFRLYRTTNSFAIFVFVIEVGYFIYITFFIFKLAKQLKKEKTNFFCGFWNCLDLLVVLASLVAISLYITLWIQVNSEMGHYINNSADLPDAYYLSVLDSSFNYAISIIVVFGTLKLIHLLRFGENFHFFMSLIGNTLGYSISFCFFVLFYFSACGSLMYLLMCKRVDSFRNITNTVSNLFGSLIGQTTYLGLQKHEAWLVMLLSTCIISFIFINLLISGLMTILKQIKQMDRITEDVHLMMLIYERTRQLFGIKRKK